LSGQQAALQQQQQGLGGKLIGGALNALGGGLPGMLADYWAVEIATNLYQ